MSTTITQRVLIRERGIYSLPDGTHVVASSDGHQNPALYYLTDWKLFGGEEVRAERNAAAFRVLEVTPQGDIQKLGQPTRWQFQDLLDTGRTAR